MKFFQILSNQIEIITKLLQNFQNILTKILEILINQKSYLNQFIRISYNLLLIKVSFIYYSSFVFAAFMHFFFQFLRLRRMPSSLSGFK